MLPHSDTVPVELPRKIGVVEQLHAGQGTCARFQISPGACPVGIDDALAERGYHLDTPMSLQSAAAAHVIDRLPAGAMRIHLDDQPTQAWFETWLAVHGTGRDPGPEWAMLRRVGRPSVYASVLTPIGVIAAGRAVAETGWAGVFSMATLPHACGRGAAGEVLVALAHWAAAHGAERMYLQVEPDNTAAWRLYERAGFAELRRYHYPTAGRVP